MLYYSIFMTQYINFTHVIYDKTEQSISDNNKQNLFNFILKYHYTCCMNIYTQAELSNEEKQEILQDEYSIFNKKLDEYNRDNMTNFSFYPIPRVLYDLFVILFILYGKIKTYANEFSESVVYANYNKYCTIVNIYHNKLSDIFWITNNSIHEM